MRALVAVLMALGTTASGLASGQEGCGPLENAYGPFDYRSSKKELNVVEQFHFTPDVESLRHGNTGALGGDLDYTLRASPNHHRALMAMVNLALKAKSAKPLGARYTVDCWFDRAIRFANDDGAVRIIYGVYLYRVGKKDEARRVLEDARRFAKDDPNLYYNLGFVYLDLGDKAKALESAQTAYRLGAQLPGLRNKLRKAGAWKDAPPGEFTGEVRTPDSGKSGAVAN